MVFDHEILIMKYFHRPGHSSFADSRRAIVSYKPKLVQENRFGYTCSRLIDHHGMSIAIVCDPKPQTKAKLFELQPMECKGGVKLEVPGC